MNIDFFMLNGTVAMVAPAAEAKTEDAKNEDSTGEITGSSATPETSGNTGGEGRVTETTGTDADMAGGDTANMAGDGMGGMDRMNGMNTEMGTSKPITQNVPVMAGITAGVLALSILAGIGLAKLKIKKGINLYED